jgi:hypothetical protein
VLLVELVELVGVEFVPDDWTELVPGELPVDRLASEELDDPGAIALDVPPSDDAFPFPCVALVEELAPLSDECDPQAPANAIATAIMATRGVELVESTDR